MEFRSDRRWFRISFALQITALCFVLIPFARFNNLLEWDFPGHYAAIWHIKEHLFPWFSGWNRFFYGGYPQGIFYPPLAHYLAALLSYPFGIALAMKMLICASILSLPPAFYLFARRWYLNDLQAAVCSAWMTALLFLCGEMFGTINFGSDLKSILNIGLFANALSLPILFFFMASCGGRVERWKTPALLLGILILIHPLSSLIGGIYWLSLALSEFMRERQDRSWDSLLKIVGIGFLIGSAWAIPFIARRGYMNPESIPALWPLALQFLVLNGTILALSHFRKMELRPLIIVFVVLANFIIIGGMWMVEFQFTRLTIYLLLFLPLFFTTWMTSRFALVMTGVFAIAVGAYGYFSSGINPKGVPDFAVPDFGKVQGRILSVAPPTHLPSFHVHHDLIPIKTGNEGILGLFIESSINGRFMGSLTRMIDMDAHVWGTPTEFIRPEFLKNNYPQYVRDRLRLFGINHIYTDVKLENSLDAELVKAKRYINSYPIPKMKNREELESLGSRYNVRNGQFDFYLYTVDNTSIAEALSYVPKNIQSNWKMTNTLWFSQTRGVPIFTNRPTPANVRGANSGERVEVIKRSPNGDKLELQIHASQDIPVFVKIGYFPNWTLKVNGKDSQIYRASPDLMLFFGRGSAVLEYKRSRLEYAGLLLSVCGFVLLVVLRK